MVRIRFPNQDLAICAGAWALGLGLNADGNMFGNIDQA